ncbi:MAG: hypothetical protein D6753_01835 [Planctomycetota bacterium]|nr:MAG: hypothetical protein D6753_01835 [Planctomycetota bacterium]
MCRSVLSRSTCHRPLKVPQCQSACQDRRPYTARRIEHGGCSRSLLLGSLLVIAGTIGCIDDTTPLPTGGSAATPAGREPASADESRMVATLAPPSTPAANPRAGEDWPRFRGPRTDGSSRERPLDPQRWDPHPPLLFTLDLGVSYGGPTIARGRLFQFCRYGDQERLTCYDAATGEPMWHRELPVRYDDMYGYNNGPRCSPVVDGDRVYTYGVAGQLTCYRVTDGDVLWTRDMNREYGVVQNFFGVASTPYVHGDLLLVMVGGSPPESQQVPNGRLDLVQPNGTAIVALNKTDGSEVYRVGDELASYSSVTVRSVAGRQMGLAFLRGGLLAWDPATGQELFHFPWRASKLESVNAAMPVTAGDTIFLSETYEIGSVLLQIAEGKPQVIWQDSGPLRQHAFRAHWATPVLVGEYLYGCSGRNQPDADFRCIRFRDGQVQWTHRTHERSSVLVVDGYLIVLGELGNLECLRPNPAQREVVAQVDLNAIADPADGHPLLSAPCWAPPVLSHGRLYLRGRDKLICLDLIPDPVVAPQ